MAAVFMVIGPAPVVVTRFAPLATIGRPMVKASPATGARMTSSPFEGALKEPVAIVAVAPDGRGASDEKVGVAVVALNVDCTVPAPVLKVSVPMPCAELAAS